MRQRKTLLLLSVVTAVLMLSVAYAAINSVTFNITGNATATGDASNFKVAFTGDYEKGGNGTITASASNQTATLKVTGLTTKGQYAYVDFYIKNSSTDLYAEITTPTVTNSNTEYFSVSTSFAGLEAHWWGASNTINPGTTAYIRVRVDLIKTPISDVSSTIKVSFSASANAGS